VGQIQFEPLDRSLECTLFAGLDFWIRHIASDSKTMFAAFKATKTQVKFFELKKDVPVTFGNILA